MQSDDPMQINATYFILITCSAENNKYPIGFQPPMHVHCL